MHQLSAVHQDYSVGKVMPPYRVTVLVGCLSCWGAGDGGSWPWGFVTQVPAELSEGQLTMTPLCKDSISPGPGRGQQDG